MAQLALFTTVFPAESKVLMGRAERDYSVKGSANVHSLPCL